MNYAQKLAVDWRPRKLPDLLKCVHKVVAALYVIGFYLLLHIICCHMVIRSR